MQADVLTSSRSVLQWLTTSNRCNKKSVELSPRSFCFLNDRKADVVREADIVKSKAVIVGIAERGSDVPECERSLDELERLLDTAGGEVFARVLQVKDSFDPRTCIGSGKVKEISDICRDSGETALASKVELAGKLSIVIISLPLVKQLLEFAKDMT